MNNNIFSPSLLSCAEEVWTLLAILGQLGSQFSARARGLQGDYLSLSQVLGTFRVTVGDTYVTIWCWRANHSWLHKSLYYFFSPCAYLYVFVWWPHLMVLCIQHGLESICIPDGLGGLYEMAVIDTWACCVHCTIIAQTCVCMYKNVLYTYLTIV